jgi:hypothetical protein
MKPAPDFIWADRAASTSGLSGKVDASIRVAATLPPKVSSSTLRTIQLSNGRFLGGEPWMLVVPPISARTSA